MAGNLILLTGEVEANFFHSFIHNFAPDTNVIHAASELELRDAVDALSDEELAATRLVVFCFNVIVPYDILRKLPGPSYNFHPGPPEAIQLNIISGFH